MEPTGQRDDRTVGYMMLFHLLPGADPDPQVSILKSCPEKASPMSAETSKFTGSQEGQATVRDRKTS